MRHAEEIFLLYFIAWRKYVGIINIRLYIHRQPYKLLRRPATDKRKTILRTCAKSLGGAREFFVRAFTPRYTQLHARIGAKKRECWKSLDWRLNSENDWRVHGPPSIANKAGRGARLLPFHTFRPLPPSRLFFSMCLAAFFAVAKIQTILSLPESDRLRFPLSVLQW